MKKKRLIRREKLVKIKFQISTENTNLHHSLLNHTNAMHLVLSINDTSHFFDDIFTIDNPEFAEHISYIYPRKANNTLVSF